MRSGRTGDRVRCEHVVGDVEPRGGEQEADQRHKDPVAAGAVDVGEDQLDDDHEADRRDGHIADGGIVGINNGARHGSSPPCGRPNAPTFLTVLL